jgi:acetylornithine/succinyldiaminopimelate/putrescine aminotransferase/predicted amino acid dehydrogenase
MTPLQLLQELWARGVALEWRDGDIRYSGPRGAVGPHLLAELRRHKAAILSLLDPSMNGEGAAAPGTQTTRASKSFGIGVERPASSPLVPDDWQHEHPYFRHVEPFKGYLLSRLGLDEHFVRGEGVWLVTESGHRVLDGIAQYGALPFGYNPPEIWAALETARERREPSFAANSRLDAAGELAARLISLWPEAGFTNVVFGNSGAEAVEAAIKLCRAATGRRRLVSTRGAFHGLTLGALSATGSRLYQEAFSAPTADVDHVPFGDADALEKVLAARPGAHAAFLVEPIQGESGIVEPPPGYLARVRHLCDRAGVLLVIDEVQTGLGRTGDMFACRHEGVVPDVMVLAKALGGGLMPIGACLYTPRARSVKFGLRHSSTFAANTLACRAALAALECLDKDGRALIAAVRDNGAFLKGGLEDLRRRFPGLIAGISGRGYMLGIRLDFSGLWRIPGLVGFMAGQNLAIHLIVSYLLNVERVRLSPSFSSGSVLRLEPPLIATREHCGMLLGSLERTLQVLESGDVVRLLAHLVGRVPEPEARRATTEEVRRPLPRPRPEEPGVGRFAFTVHLMSNADLIDLDPALEQFDPEQLLYLKEQLIEYIDPVPVGAIEIESKNGTRAYGELILVPYTAEELLAMPVEKAHDEVRLAVQVAQERGARVVGLGGFTSIVTQGGLALDSQGLPPLTSGNAYTAVVAKNAVLRTCRDRGLGLDAATLGIVGAAGMIGRATALLLAEHVGRLVLVGNDRYPERTRTRLREVGMAVVRRLWEERERRRPFAPGSLAGRVIARGSSPSGDGKAPDFAGWFDLAEREGDIVITHDHAADLPRADVVIAATSSVRAFIGAQHLKHGAIVCDVARPFNVDPAVQAARPDVSLIEGGLVRVGGHMEGSTQGGPRPNVLYACVAETILWALEGAFDRLRPDTAMSMDAIEELEAFGTRHGFEVETGV